MNIEQKLSEHCWSAEGLWGDSSCPELAEFVSCQRCPAYISAVGKLYGRPIPEEFLMSDKFNAQCLLPADDKKCVRLFVFSCADTLFAFPSQAVSSVSKRRMLHRIPHRTDGAIEGIVNVDGELVMSLGILRVLGFSSSKSRSDSSMLIVCGSGDRRFAFFADSVLGVRNFDADESEIPDSVSALKNSEKPSRESRFIERIFFAEDRRVYLVDFELLTEAVAKQKI